MTYLSAMCSKSGTAPYLSIYISSMVMFLQRQNLQGSRTQTSNPHLLLGCHTLGRRAVHLWFGVMEHITLGSQENNMLLRNNGIFCLRSWLAPFIYTRNQWSLASTPPGTPSNSNSQNHEVFKINREERQEQERTWHTCPETEANRFQSHKLGRVKLLHSLHIPWYFQAKLLAAKGPIHPTHCSAHTPPGKCWNAVWCLPQEGVTKSLTNGTPCRSGTERTFLSESWDRTGESAWSSGAASKATSKGTDKSVMHLAFGKVLNSLVKKKKSYV